MFKFKNIHLDDETMSPEEVKVALDHAFEDHRGYIQSIVNFPMKNFSMISSHKGKLRANHMHQTDWHYMYMFKGQADYYFKHAESDDDPEIIVWKTGQLIFTPPMEIHTTVFTEDSHFIAISRNPRDQEAYEADVKRVQLVDPESVKI